MSALELPPTPERRPGAFSDPAGRATGAAGALLVGGLALALGGVGGTGVPLAVAGAGTVAAAFVLGPGAARAARRHGLLLATAAVLLAGLVALVPVSMVLGVGGLGAWLVLPAALAVQLAPLVLVVGAAAGGLVLVADDLRGRLGLTDGPRTPWQRLSGRPAGGDPGRAASPAPWRGLAGLALIAGSALVGFVLAGFYVGSAALLELVVLLAVGAAALVLMATPLLIAGLARADRGHVETAREDERQRMAAHLHDSVLQTLALVQRQASDPIAVARLARRQEQDLRAWMAGEAELGSETLGAALRDAVAEVEDEHGTAVEVTILGDRPLDRPGEALAAAAREALRNAARHAPGAPVFVFAQAGPHGAEAFVRDEGPGFELGAVPTERRGVRDAIVGRMAAAGGRAWVESVPGEGTEVVLRIDAPEPRA